MLGCDNCDQWFHGSCMKLDKEACEALSKWICPPCSNKVSVESVQVEERNAAVSDKKHPAQEMKSIIIEDKHEDVSPHAPNPLTLWPPFGLRSCESAIEALGKLGDSDCEDFDAFEKKTVNSIISSRNDGSQSISMRNPPPK